MSAGELIALFAIVITIAGGFLAFYTQTIRMDEKLNQQKVEIQELKRRHEKLLDFLEKKL